MYYADSVQNDFPTGQHYEWPDIGRVNGEFKCMNKTLRKHRSVDTGGGQGALPSQ